MPFVDSAVSGQESGASTQTLTLSTSNSDNIIVVLAYAEQTTTPSITGVSASGLTFTRRSRSHSSTTGNLELWWAVAATPLSAVAITITYAAAFDDASAVAAAITGCDTSSPWDTNASSSQQQGGNTSFNPTYTVSSNASAGMILYSSGTADSSGLNYYQSVPAGYLSLPDSANRGGAIYSDVRLGVKAFSSALSGASIVGPTLYAGNNGAEASLDVLVGVSVPGQVDPPSVAATATSLNGGNTDFTVNLNGVSAGDVVCLLAYAEMGGSQPSITSVTATGLTFALRSRSHASAIGDLELWWATAASGGDYAISFTYASIIDDGSFTAFSVSGTDPAGPWDTNVDASQTQGATSVPSFTVSTNAPSALLLACGGSAASGQSAGSGPTGFLSIPGEQNGGGTLYANNVLAVKSVFAPQSSVTFGWSDSISMTNDGAEALFEAFASPPGSGGGTPADPTATTKQGQKASGTASVGINASVGTSQGQSDTSLMLIANASHVSGAASTNQAQGMQAIGEARLDWSLIDRVLQQDDSGTTSVLPPHDIKEGTHVAIAVSGFSSDLPTSVTDSAGNVYTLAVSASKLWTDTIAQGVAIYTALNLHLYAGNIITVNWPAAPGRRTVLAYYFSSPLRAVVDAFASAIVDSGDHIASSTLTTSRGSGFVIGVEHAHGTGTFNPDSSTSWTPSLDASFTDDIGYASDGYKVYRSDLSTTFTMQGTEPTRHRLIALLAVGDAGPQVFTYQGQKASGAAAQIDIADTAHTFQSQGAVAEASSRDKFRVYDSQSHAESNTASVGGGFAMPPMDVVAGKHLVVGITFLDAPTYPQTYTISDSDGGTWTLLAHESYLLPGSSDQRSFHHMWWMSVNRRQAIGNVVTLHNTYSPTSFAFSEIQFESDFMPKLDTHVGAIFQPYSQESYADITTSSPDGGLLFMSTQGGNDRHGFFTEGRVTGDPNLLRYPDPNSHIVNLPGDYSIASPLFGYEPINSNLTGATRSHWGNRNDITGLTNTTSRSISLVALAVEPSAMIGNTTQSQSATATGSVSGAAVSDMVGGGAQGQKPSGTMVVSSVANILTAQVQSSIGDAATIGVGGVMTIQGQSTAASGSTATASSGSAGQGQSPSGTIATGVFSTVVGSQGQSTQINAVVGVLVDVGGIQAQSVTGEIGARHIMAVAAGQAQGSSGVCGVTSLAVGATRQGQRVSAAVVTAIASVAATGQGQSNAGEARSEVMQSVATHQAQASSGVAGTATNVTAITSQAQHAGATVGTAVDTHGGTAQGQRMGQQLSELHIVFDVTCVTGQAQGTEAVGPPAFAPQLGDLTATMKFSAALQGQVGMENPVSVIIRTEAALGGRVEARPES